MLPKVFKTAFWLLNRKESLQSGICSRQRLHYGKIWIGMGIYNKFKCIENTFSKYKTINKQIENKKIKHALVILYIICIY